MATEIKMPQLSDTMASGKIVVWRKKEGDQVNRGDALAEVETDKANLEIECFHPGILLKIVTAEGSAAAVGEVIAVIGQAGESVTATSEQAAPASAVSPASIPSPETTASQSKPAETGPAIHHASSGDSRIIASPLAKKIAADSNLNLGSLTGSGPGGRIVRKDVEAALSQGQTIDSKPVVSTAHFEQQTTVSTSTSSSSSSTVTGSLSAFSKMRETIARRMQESVNTNPHFYVTTSINMEASSKLRELLKEKPEYKGISVSHLIIKAAAYALRQVPAVNCSVKEGKLYSPDAVNIGMVTALPDGLLIPVIKDADKLALKDIVFETKAATDRAKAGRPNSSDLSGGTFSISNMGMFDVENFTAIINPGQGAILAVSSAKSVPIAEDGKIKIARIMKVTLSSDHRIIDGIMAANFLKQLKQALEVPALMILD